MPCAVAVPPAASSSSTSELDSCSEALFRSSSRSAMAARHCGRATRGVGGGGGRPGWVGGWWYGVVRRAGGAGGVRSAETQLVEPPPASLEPGCPWRTTVAASGREWNWVSGREISTTGQTDSQREGGCFSRERSYAHLTAGTTARPSPADAPGRVPLACVVCAGRRARLLTGGELALPTTTHHTPPAHTQRQHRTRQRRHNINAP